MVALRSAWQADAEALAELGKRAAGLEAGQEELAGLRAEHARFQERVAMLQRLLTVRPPPAASLSRSCCCGTAHLRCRPHCQRRPKCARFQERVAVLQRPRMVRRAFCCVSQQELCQGKRAPASARAVRGRCAKRQGMGCCLLSRVPCSAPPRNLKTLHTAFWGVVR